jgi:hypothetical protein
VLLVEDTRALRARLNLDDRATAGGAPVFAEKKHSNESRQAAPGAGDFCGDEKRRPSVGARSALRDLTCRICLSAVSEANVASYAARLEAEHRSGAGALAQAATA